MCNVITNELGAALMVQHPSSGSSTSTIVNSSHLFFHLLFVSVYVVSTEC